MAMFGRPDDEEYLKEQFFNDRPMAFGGGICEDWESLKSTRDRMLENNEDVSGLTLDELKSRNSDEKN